MVLDPDRERREARRPATGAADESPGDLARQGRPAVEVVLGAATDVSAQPLRGALPRGIDRVDADTAEDVGAPLSPASVVDGRRLEAAERRPRASVGVRAGQAERAAEREDVREVVLASRLEMEPDLVVAFERD